MKYQDQFFFLMQDNTISVPGKFPVRTAVHTVKFNRNSKFDGMSLTPDEQMTLFQTAYRGKLWKRLEQRKIPGFTQNFPWGFQYARAGLTQNQAEPVVFIRADVASHLDRLLWEPLQNLIRKSLKKYPEVQVELPILPAVFQASHLRKWYANNRAAERFFLQPRKIVNGYRRGQEQAKVRAELVREA